LTPCHSKQLFTTKPCCLLNDITPDAKSYQVYKFPLTEADSSDFDTSGSTYFKVFQYAINSLNVPFNKLAACQVSFKPGYAYNLMDTLTAKNTLRFGTWQEADNAYPTYVSGDWNVSGILITDVRYNLDPNWNGFYIPTYAYTAPYSLEHHDIWWKVSALNVGMKDIDANGNALGVC
jgi:hypothetical protein